MLYLEDMQKLHCETPGCDHSAHGGLFINPACHPGGGVEVEFVGEGLRIRCYRCGKYICTIAVGGNDEHRGADTGPGQA